MSRRSHVLLVAPIAAVALLLWALWPSRLAIERDTSVQSITAIAPVASAAPSPLPLPPTAAPLPDPPALADPVPLLDATTEPGVGANTDEFAGTTAIIVTVLIDGDPLLAVLHRLGIEYQDVHVLATLAATGARLDESLAPYYDRQGLGKFTPHRNDWNEDIVVGPSGCLGKLTIPLRFPMHVSVALGSAVLATRVLEEPQPELTIELPLEDLAADLGKLRGRFVSAATQLPIVDAELTIGPLAFVMSNTNVKTDAQGLVEHTAAPGPVWIGVTAAGFEQLNFLMRVSRGDTCDLGDIALHPAGTVSGTLKRASGDPASEGLVALVPVDSSVDALQAIAMAMFTDHRDTDEGRFALPSGRRRYLLVGYDDDGIAVIPIDATQGDVTGLELTLGPYVMLTVRLPPDPLDSIRLRLWTKDRLPVTSWPGWTGNGDDEEMEVPLVPGEYVLAGDSRSQGKWTRAITIGTEPVTIDVGEEDRK